MVTPNIPSKQYSHILDAGSLYARHLDRFLGNEKRREAALVSEEGPAQASNIRQQVDQIRLTPAVIPAVAERELAEGPDLVGYTYG